MSIDSETNTSLSPIKMALLKIKELKEQLDQAGPNNDEPIAIVSMACRFPKSADSVEAFWKDLCEQTDLVSEIPQDRWDLEEYYDADPDAIGKMYARKGVFLDQIDQMDADFFGISPREATWVDPQQRLLMEVGWEALERAGWPADKIGRETGMFIGWMHNDYQNEASDSLLNLNPYIATGSAGSFLSGRLSYHMGLNGPSLAVETACSSSLVALHLACQSLRQGECSRALVGGVNAMVSPKTNVLTCKLRALSPSGHSRAFDATADGYLRGEGCGVVAIRKLSDAKADGDPILAVIRGSALSHNGNSSGLTAPNPEAQEIVIREALERAKVQPNEIDYLEAHGTGTELGDPIEMRAASAVLSEGRNQNSPLLVGSVKTNIGHLEAAAGMAGLIKVVLALQNEQIPAHLGFETPNPHIDWENMPLKVTTKPVAWPNSKKRIAGVSAFGMSGTNSHIVVENAPSEPTHSSNGTTPKVRERSHHLLVLSGKSDEALQDLAQRYLDWFVENPNISLADVCYTAGAGRKHFDRRAAFVVESVEHARSLLNDFLQGRKADGVFHGQAKQSPKMAWQFTGQGSQYVGMAKSLYEAQPVFKKVLDDCEEALKEIRGVSLLEIIFENEEQLNQTTWTQPALYSIEIALAKLLQSWGLKPELVLGHSVGQFAASVVAGMMNWRDGLELISKRSQLTGDLPAGGAMAAVFLSDEEIQKRISDLSGLSVAAYNGAHCVISGPEKEIDQVLAKFKSEKIRGIKLKTSHAFHSSLLDPILDEFEKIAGQFDYQKAERPLVCNVSGELLPVDQIFDGAYWRDHLRQPVRFAQSVQTASDEGCTLLLELGPQPTLTGMAATSKASKLPALVPTLQKTDASDQPIAAALAQLYVHGLTPDFEAFDEPWHRKKIVLPTYPFQRQRFWGPPKPQLEQVLKDTSHPLLGSNRPLAGVTNETRYENFLAPDNPRWLEDHKVFEDVVFPGAGSVEMVLSSARKGAVIESLNFEMPLRIESSTCAQTIVSENDQQQKTIEIHTLAQGASAWSRNVSAIESSENVSTSEVDVKSIFNRCESEVDVQEFYQALFGLGLNYGPQFQTIQNLKHNDEEIISELKLHSDARGFLVPPMLLDGAFQSLAIGLLRDPNSSLFLPVGVERLECIEAVQGDVFCHAKWTHNEGDLRTADLDLINESGRVVLKVRGLKLRAASRSALRQMSGSGPERLIHTIRWKKANLESDTARKSHWLIIANDAAQSTALESELKTSDQLVTSIGVSDPLPNDDQSIDGILWLVDADDSDSTKRNCSGILDILTKLREKEITRLDRGFQIITKMGVASNDKEVVNPEMSQYWGLGRAIAAEAPNLQCRLIDVDAVQENTKKIVETILVDSQENQIAVRSDSTFIPRLLPASNKKSEGELKVENNASYLITGGLGMLGRQAGKWLAKNGAGNVVLVSRRAPDDATQLILNEIEELGCKVHVEQADFGDRSQVESLFKKIENELPQLKGVIHTAGVLDDGLLPDQTWERFEKVLAPKKQGALLLEEFTADKDLDFFVLYSSVASVLGSPGQGNYATANSFLDGLAQRRRANGLPALNINWGPWDEGMAANETVSRRLATQGITALTSEESHDAMEMMLNQQLTQATVLDVDWNRLRQRLGASAPQFLSEVSPQGAVSMGVDSALVEKIVKAQGTERTRILNDYLSSVLQEVLALEEAPDSQTPLSELGLDSLMSVEFSMRLQQQLGEEFNISPTLAFDYPTVDAMSEYLATVIEEQPEAEQPVVTINQTEREDIAIVGLACRFPGADNIDEFWDLISNGVDAISPVPTDRWNVDEYYSEDRESGKIYVKEGGFVPSINQFDAEFFGISDKEACWMDPQHRVLLETSWQAMENAGITTDSLPNSRGGVFMGIMSQDYAQLHTVDDTQIIDGFQGAGLAHSAGVGRLSYLFGFEGPCMAIDSASSSSLVAVSQAAKSLMEGDCDLALSGGVNAILAPMNSVLLCKAGMLSPDGRCKSFSAKADGFARGEGCGVIVMKRLSDAVRDGDDVKAIIRGSAVCHNGMSGSLTAPSGRSQERVIREAVQKAGLHPTDIDYLEAHGTGTEYGDPIEIRAAAAALGNGRSADKPLLLGTVKANIGHLEAAGGISGLIKVILAMQHDELPQQLHFEEPSPHIPWDQIPFKMVTESQPWPNPNRKIASVSALGMSGTNAHVVLEGGPSKPKVESNIPERTHHLLPLSAKSPSVLLRLMESYSNSLEENPEINLADFCYTASTGRKHNEYRAAFVASDLNQMKQKLQTELEPTSSRSTPKTAWYFSSEFQSPGVTDGSIYDTFPMFKETASKCSKIKKELEKIEIFESIKDSESDAIRGSMNIFITQIGIAEQLKSWGVYPDVVFGVGIGHYVAAVLAGIITIEDAVRLVFHRSCTLRKLSASGEEESVLLWDEFEKYADQFDYLPADRPIVSGLTGNEIPVHQVLGGSYWREEAEGWRRGSKIHGLLNIGFTTIKSMDCELILDWSKESDDQHLVDSTRHVNLTAEKKLSAASILDALGELYIAGATPNFKAFDAPWSRNKITLPNYPFDRKRYWITDLNSE